MAPSLILVERSGQEPITISQKDVRELRSWQKPPLRAGIQTLVATAGLTESDIEQVIIAGAFGTFIDIASAITIGRLPPLPLECFSQVGNAAGDRRAIGAHLYRPARQCPGNSAQRAGYIELAKVPNFQRKFAEATYL